MKAIHLNNHFYNSDLIFSTDASYRQLEEKIEKQFARVEKYVPIAIIWQVGKNRGDLEKLSSEIFPTHTQPTVYQRKTLSTLWLCTPKIVYNHSIATNNRKELS